MCDALLTAGIAASVGSTVLQGIGQSRVDAARASVMRQERERQDALDREAAGLNTQSQDRYQNFGQQQGDRAQKLGDYFKAQQITNPTPTLQAEGVTAPVSSSNITVQEEAKQNQKARDYSDRQGDALGNLRSFGDLLGGKSRDQARDAGYIGQIGGFKKGSAGIVPEELEAANMAGARMSTLGQLLGAGGSIMTGLGLRGGYVSPGTAPIPTVPTSGGGFSNLTTFAQPLARAPLALGGANISLPRFAAPNNPFRVY